MSGEERDGCLAAAFLSDRELQVCLQEPYVVRSQWAPEPTRDLHRRVNAIRDARRPDLRTMHFPARDVEHAAGVEEKRLS
jgi:hypothetical protein